MLKVIHEIYGIVMMSPSPVDGCVYLLNSCSAQVDDMSTLNKSKIWTPKAVRNQALAKIERFLRRAVTSDIVE